jgi:hypothetical protein
MTTEIHSTDIDPSDPAASPPIRVGRIVRPICPMPSVKPLLRHQ